MERAARWTLWFSSMRHQLCRHIYLLRLASSERTARKRRTRRRSGRAVPVPEFLLVGDSRYCWRLLWFGVRLHEYGKPDRSGTHRILHSMDRGPIWLDNVISGSSFVVPGRRSELAGGGSVPTAHSPPWSTGSTSAASAAESTPRNRKVKT